MVVDYFKKTDIDTAFYNEFIKPRIPEKIIDMHMHISTEEMRKNCTPDPNDWAVQCGSVMRFEDYAYYRDVLYPDSSVEANVLPCVTRGVDVDANNAYLANLKKEGKARYAMMMVDPAWDHEYVEKVLTEGNFDGCKPYPDFVSGVKGSEIGLFDFIKPEQLAVFNKYKKAMVLHLPRAGRFPDDNNIKELRAVKDKYPDIKLIIAHVGRCYATDHIKSATEKLGDDRYHFSYDIAAVLNPAVLEYVLEKYPQDKIMYGTDLPVFLWHGKRRWTETTYTNMPREDFPFNKHIEGAEKEAKYTFFLYEQLKNILDTTYEAGGKKLAEDVFYNNAERILQ